MNRDLEVILHKVSVSKLFYLFPFSTQRYIVGVPTSAHSVLTILNILRSSFGQHGLIYASFGIKKLARLFDPRRVVKYGISF